VEVQVGPSSRREGEIDFKSESGDIGTVDMRRDFLSRWAAAFPSEPNLHRRRLRAGSGRRILNQSLGRTKKRGGGYDVVKGIFTDVGKKEGPPHLWAKEDHSVRAIRGRDRLIPKSLRSTG